METKTFMFNKENYFEKIEKDIILHSDALQKSHLTDNFIVYPEDVKIGQSYVLMNFVKFLV